MCNFAIWFILQFCIKKLAIRNILHCKKHFATLASTISAHCSHSLGLAVTSTTHLSTPINKSMKINSCAWLLKHVFSSSYNSPIAGFLRCLLNFVFVCFTRIYSIWRDDAPLHNFYVHSLVVLRITEHFDQCPPPSLLLGRGWKEPGK